MSIPLQLCDQALSKRKFELSTNAPQGRQQGERLCIRPHQPLTNAAPIVVDHLSNTMIETTGFRVFKSKNMKTPLLGR